MNTITSTDDPIERARRVYREEVCIRNFEEDLCLHLMTSGCIVYKDKSNLALVRPVNKSYTYHELTNPEHVSENPDCWWVYLLIGDIVSLTSMLPYDLEWIGWERKNKPRFYKLQQLKRCLHM